MTGPVKTNTLKAGDRLADGSIYAGISPETGRPMYVMADDRRAANFHEAMLQVRDEKSHGHSDWRLPTIAELRVLFDARAEGALRGTFNVAARIYTSRTATRSGVLCLRFRDGAQREMHKGSSVHMRCVRSPE